MIRKSLTCLARTAVVLSLTTTLLPACGGGSGPGDEMKPGQTDFTTTAPGQSNGLAGGAKDNAAPTAGNAGATAMAPGAPGGRVADVQEADIYRVDHNRLFYLNTYRGFVAYDVNDTKHPVLLGRLPVYGYPVEMFVKDNTVYALLRDSLYLTQQNGTFQFQRFNV